MTWWPEIQHDLYEELSRLDGTQQDPCVLDVMTAVVRYAETGESVPWWHFSAERKAGRGRPVTPETSPMLE